MLRFMNTNENYFCTLFPLYSFYHEKRAKKSYYFVIQITLSLTIWSQERKKLFCECWAESKRQNNYTYQTEHSHFQNGIKSGSLDVSVADRRHQQNAGVIPTKHVKNKKPVESDLNKYAQTMPIVSVNYRIMVVSFVIFGLPVFFIPSPQRKSAIFIE